MKLFSIVLFLALFLFPTLQVPVSFQEESGAQEFSSLGAPPICRAIFAKNSKRFNFTDFEQALQNFRSKEYLDANDLNDVARSPERLLAALEFFLTQGPQQKYAMRDNLSQLSERQLKNLSKTLVKVKSDTLLSEAKTLKLLAEVYRQVHRPPGFWRTMFGLRSFNDVTHIFEKVEDRVIEERISMALMYKGYSESFRALIKDPTLLEKFHNTLERKKFWVATTLILGLWAVQRWTVNGTPDLNLSLLMQGLLWFPPYIAFKNIFKFYSVEQISEILIREGQERGIEIIESKERIPIRKNQFYKYFRWTYNFVFMSIFLTTINEAADLHAEAAVREQTARAAQISESREQGLQDLKSPFADIGVLSPEQLAEKEFNDMVNEARANGRAIDVNSPEWKKIKQGMIEDRRQSYAQTGVQDKVKEIETRKSQLPQE